jgi:hypothetical protein
MPNPIFKKDFYKIFWPNIFSDKIEKNKSCIYPKCLDFGYIFIFYGAQVPPLLFGGISINKPLAKAKKFNFQVALVYLCKIFFLAILEHALLVTKFTVFHKTNSI